MPCNNAKAYITYRFFFTVSILSDFWVQEPDVRLMTPKSWYSDVTQESDWMIHVPLFLLILRYGKIVYYRNRSPVLL